MNSSPSCEESTKSLSSVGATSMMNGSMWRSAFDLDRQWYSMCLREWMALLARIYLIEMESDDPANMSYH